MVLSISCLPYLSLEKFSSLVGFVTKHHACCLVLPHCSYLATKTGVCGLASLKLKGKGTWVAVFKILFYKLEYLNIFRVPKLPRVNLFLIFI